MCCFEALNVLFETSPLSFLNFSYLGGCRRVIGTQFLIPGVLHSPDISPYNNGPAPAPRRIRQRCSLRTTWSSTDRCVISSSKSGSRPNLPAESCDDYSLRRVSSLLLLSAADPSLVNPLRILLNLPLGSPLRIPLPVNPFSIL